MPFISCKLGNLNLKPNESFGLLDTGASGTFISEVLFAKIPISDSYICGKKKTYLTTASETRRLIGVKLAKIPLTLTDSNNQTHTEMWNFTIYDLKSNDLYFGCDFILDSKFKPSMDKNHLTLTLPTPKRTQIKIPIFRLPLGRKIHLFATAQFTIPPRSIRQISTFPDITLPYLP